VGFAPELAGPHRPVTSTPDRQAGWIRRTSSIDTHRPDGLSGARATIDARARDLLTGPDGAATVIESVGLLVEVAQPSLVLSSIDASPASHELEALIGARVAGGFRARVTEASTGENGPQSLRYLLLDDLPGATLVSGFALQYAATLIDPDAPVAGASEHPELILAQADICAGWGRDAVMLTAFRRTKVLMTPLGPAAPRLEVEDDRSAWHEMAPLRPHGMRRRRRLDLGPSTLDGTSPFDAHFRDSHVDADGHETVVHEYTVTGRVNVESRQVTEIAAEARVLPWIECPAAVGSAQRIVGWPLSDLRRRVRTDLTGLSTCTHLNDTLRTLADLDALIDHR